MSTQLEIVFEAAKQLSTEEQVALAARLFELLNPRDPEWEAAWLAECEARVAAVERGEMEVYDSEDVMAELRAKYNIP